MANVILDNANNVTLTRSSNTRRAISNSGYARIERAGPTFYGLEIDLRILDTANYRLVNNALIDLEDGIGFLETTLPSKFRITNKIGTFSETTAQASANQSGTEVMIESFTTGETLLKGDFIQFYEKYTETGSSVEMETLKVYQIIEDVTLSSTNNKIKLNTGLIRTPGSSNIIRVGNDVEFKFLLSESPQVNILPQNQNNNLYNYSTINLQEVL